MWVCNVCNVCRCVYAKTNVHMDSFTIHDTQKHSSFLFYSVIWSTHKVLIMSPLVPLYGYVVTFNLIMYHQYFVHM